MVCDAAATVPRALVTAAPTGNGAGALPPHFGAHVFPRQPGSRAFRLQQQLSWLGQQHRDSDAVRYGAVASDNTTATRKAAVDFVIASRTGEASPQIRPPTESKGEGVGSMRPSRWVAGSVLVPETRTIRNELIRSFYIKFIMRQPAGMNQ